MTVALIVLAVMCLALLGCLFLSVQLMQGAHERTHRQHDEERSRMFGEYNRLLDLAKAPTPGWYAERYPAQPSSIELAGKVEPAMREVEDPDGFFSAHVPEDA